MLTRLGWGVLSASVLLGGAGFLLGYPEFAALGTVGVVAVAFGVLWTLSQARLTVRRQISPHRVARGDPAIAMLSVTGHGRGIRFGITAHDQVDGSPVAVALPRTAAGASRTISYRLPTERRGEIPVGPLRLIQTDPFGFVRRERTHGEATVLLVRPRTVPLPVLPAGRAHHLEGASTDNAPAGTVTFHTLREYVRGDDLRHVHWRTSARHGTLLMKHLIDIALPHTTILLDMRPSAYPSPGDVEVAVDAAASAAQSAARHGFPVRIMSNGGPIVESQGDPEAVLDALTLAGMSDDSMAAATGLIRRVPPGGTLVVITGTVDALAQVAGARKRHRRIVCIRVVGAERPARILLPETSVIDVAELEELTTAWSAA